MEARSTLFAAVTFPDARRGYDRAQVDSFLAELGAKVEQLQGLWRAAHQRVGELEAQLEEQGIDAAVDVSDDPSAFPGAPTDGDRVAVALGGIRFAEVRDGYDRRQVDRFLRDAGEQIASLQDLYRRDAERAVVAEQRLAVSHDCR
jgi:DivIVA domain-containing protein